MIENKITFMKTEELIEIVLARCDEIKQGIDEIRLSLTSGKLVMNANDVCRYTGLSKATVYRLCSGGILPHSKPTGSLLFFRKDLVDKFLQQNEVVSAGTIDGKTNDFVIQKSGKKYIKRKN
ncbi:MAG: DNA-binding protein [Sphingobacteriales bacterium]|nr:MAG: DNA-binding protein [Sphingobacteriales bacterium]